MFLHVRTLSEPPMMRVGWLGLPRFRAAFVWIDAAIYLLALAGAARLYLRGRRRTLAILAACLVGRCLIYAWVIPNAVTERYLVEAFPIFVVLAAAALDGWAPTGEHAVDERQPILPPE